jgi:sugar/nucleoside kinase (ribokinase family)
MLRDLEAGQRTRRRPPGPSALVRRANVVGVSHLDLDPGTRIDSLLKLCRPDVTLVLTDGAQGGLVFDGGVERRYPAIAAERTVDPTGAGDVFLAAFLAARAAPAKLGGPGGRAAGLRLAAAAASLVVERPGLLGVPDLRAVTRRIASTAAARKV